MHFEQLNIPTFLVDALKKLNITEPTPIQLQSIPSALQGRDILASSPTGSGKTLAYLLPLIINLLNTENTTALVLAPTRELAAQVRDTLVQLLPNRLLESALLIGGEDINRQFIQLKRRPRIIIGTPGRITDHLKRKTLNLNLTSFLALDETDRMLEMGFSEALEYILSNFKIKNYQTFMFSATLPPFIIQLTEKYLDNPERVLLGKNQVAPPQITQQPIYLASKEKFTRLLSELSEREGTIIVFVKTKIGADDLTRQLKEYDHKVEVLHGDLRQHKRDRAIKAFRAQKARIMVATDIASRGLDIPHVQYVINYDVPQCSEDYLHRIGRTGRAGASGHAISLVSPGEMARWKLITKMKPTEQKPSATSSQQRDNRKIASTRGSQSYHKDNESTTSWRDKNYSSFGAKRNSNSSNNNKSRFNEHTERVRSSKKTRSFFN